MTTDSRLQHLEDEFETVKQLLTSAASYAESANRGLDRLEGKVERLSDRVDEFVFQAQRLFTQQAERSQQLENQFQEFQQRSQHRDRGYHAQKS